MRGPRLARGLAAVVFSWLVLNPAPKAQSAGVERAAMQPGTGEPAITYRLDETLADVPWELTAGRYGNAGDICSVDARQFILDTRHHAIHILDASSVAARVSELPDPQPGELDRTWSPFRLDCGFDPIEAVLWLAIPGRNVGFGYVQIYDPAGNLQSGFAISAQNGQFTDIAVGPDGAIYVTRAPLAGIFAGEGSVGVDMYSRDGRLLGVIEDPAHMTYLDGIDISSDGTVHLINRIPVPSAGPGDPGPTPTPYPSFGNAPEQQTEPPSTAIEGILIYDPRHEFREQVPFVSAEDIAVGPAGVFVSRQVEIFRLRESEPMFSGSTGRVYAAYFGRAAFHLEAPADGRLLASVAHCYFQGVMTFSRPADRPAEPTLRGETDAPELEGPVYPIRAAADEWLGVLHGRYTAHGRPGPNRAYQVQYYAQEFQTVQRWGADGRLLSQLGVCSGSEAFWVRDIALDGDTVYTIDPLIVHSRPYDGFPAWRYWPGSLALPLESSRLAAIGADGGRVAVLDQGAGRIVVLDQQGALTDSWLWTDHIDGMPVDLAVHAGEVFLAESGGRRVHRFTLDGTPVADWPIHDAPLAMDVGPEGDVYILGRAGWGMRYTPDGSLVAAWSMPDSEVRPQDIAVASDGRVRVPYYRVFQTATETFEIVDSGIWVFAPVPGEPKSPPDTQACIANPDKWAAPESIPLGDQVDVFLSVEGRCPGAYDPVQLALVLDVSRSMNWEDARERAMDAALALVENLDAGSAEVALVVFGEVTGVTVPLTHDHGEISEAISGQDAWGDSRMGDGLAAALQELTGPNRNPDARQVVAVLTDGVAKDDPLPAASDLRAAGIETFMLVFPNRDFDPADITNLELVTGDPDRLVVSPSHGTLEALADDLVNYVPEPGLFETIEIRDVVPDNMTYIEGSAVPPVASVSGKTLIWQLPATPAATPINLTYKLRPEEVGTWPTNVRADADYIDALGNPGSLEFPVPYVRIWDRGSLGFKAYLPASVARGCVKRGLPIDVVLVIDASVSMTDETPQGGTKLEAARTAAELFLGELGPRDRAGLVAFNDEAYALVPLTADSSRWLQGLDDVQVSPGTLIDKGIDRARELLAMARPEANAAVILLTDGRHNRDAAEVTAAADRLKATDALLFTVGLGADVDRDLLRTAATAPRHYYEAPDVDALQAIYREIAAILPCAR